MAEQILHGSNVVTAAEQGRRERVAEGVRCGGLRDACLLGVTMVKVHVTKLAAAQRQSRLTS